MNMKTLGDRIYSPRTERMTAQQAEDRELAPSQRAVSLDGLVGIGTTTRPETTVPARERCEKQPIRLNQETKQPGAETRRGR